MNKGLIGDPRPRPIHESFSGALECIHLPSRNCEGAGNNGRHREADNEATNPVHQASRFEPLKVFIVNRSIQNFFTLSALCLCAAAAQAADDPASKGLYVGAALGRGSFGAKDLGLPKAASDETGMAGKLYGGYRFTDTWGVEAGYARLGGLKETLTVGSNSVTQSASGRSLYVAGTGRLPLSSAFALNAKAGVSFGKVSGTNVLPAASDMTGSKRSFMYGVGAEYRLSQNVALTADFDHFGRLSDKVRGNMVSAGVRYAF